MCQADEARKENQTTKSHAAIHAKNFIHPITRRRENGESDIRIPVDLCIPTTLYKRIVLCTSILVVYDLYIHNVCYAVYHFSARMM